MLPYFFRMWLSSFSQEIHTSGYKEGFLKCVQAFGEWVGLFWGPVLLGLVLIRPTSTSSEALCSWGKEIKSWIWACQCNWMADIIYLGHFPNSITWALMRSEDNLHRLHMMYLNLCHCVKGWAGDWPNGLGAWVFQIWAWRCLWAPCEDSVLLLGRSSEVPAWELFSLLHLWYTNDVWLEQTAEPPSAPCMK